MGDSRDIETLTSKSSGIEYAKAALEPAQTSPVENRDVVTRNDRETSGDDAS
jgi:hypothetical protein